MKITRASNGKISNISLNGFEAMIILTLGVFALMIVSEPPTTVPLFWLTGATYLMMLFLSVALFMVGKITVRMSVNV